MRESVKQRSPMCGHDYRNRRHAEMMAGRLGADSLSNSALELPAQMVISSAEI